MQQHKGPDGKIHTFPDDASPEQVQKAMTGLYSNQGGGQKQGPAANSPRATAEEPRTASASQSLSQQPSGPLGRMRDHVTSIPREQLGALDTAATLATGTVAEAVGGLSGLGQAAYNYIRGDDDVLNGAAERIESVRNALTYQPRTEEGQRNLKHLGTLVEPLEAAAKFGGRTTTDLTGSPAAGTVVHTAIESLPGAVGIRGVRGRGERRQRAAEFEQVAEDAGVDLNRTQGEQFQQVVDAMGNESLPRGAGMPGIKDAMVKAKQQAREVRDVLYKDARSTDASVPSNLLSNFEVEMRGMLKEEGFNPPSMKIVHSRLGELESLNRLPPNSSVKLSAIDQYRKQLNRDRPAKTDETQNAALNIMKAHLDNYMDTLFDADMISGDPAAIAKWKKAREAHASYKKRFKDERVIRNMIEQDATPETMRAWVLGANATGARTEASNIVKRLKKEVGENSPQFKAFRQDAMFDIAEPLLRETPDIKGFLRHYDRTTKKNPTLAKELFPESLSALHTLARITEANAKIPTKILGIPRVDKALAVFFAGHELAVGALRVGLITNLFGMIPRALGKSRKRQIIEEALGYDPHQLMFGATAPAAMGSTQTIIDENNENEQGER